MKLEDIETLCDYSTKNFDTRKGLNRSEKKIPKDLIEQIEDERFTFEMIQTLGKSFPIFKYKTCLTIHGNFNLETVPKIGGYKSVVQNKNGSIEVKWVAIDLNKKNEIYSKVSGLNRICDIPIKWNFYTNSSSSSFSCFKVITKENAEKVLSDFRQLERNLKAINFIGKVGLYKGTYYG